ncbi:hypothetical protein N7539_008585 [Penicillium diatomitis]|uniref:Thioesterase domain-containing protein n=1 Tax=Penicillium diatomitis TaxID=2819901 RepID=A0A9W9WR72_9EURO|nr:uncharacterized protein N7539_008585 [Penicillium diatomitis]KAJ5472016.1 hypothetical protein N7539_008585 [Penicillium diatomitis]
MSSLLRMTGVLSHSSLIRTSGKGICLARRSACLIVYPVARSRSRSGVIIHKPIRDVCSSSTPSSSQTKPLDSGHLYGELLAGYRPDFSDIDGSRHATVHLDLNAKQRICYYPRKVHGGYQAFLLDQLFADCCNPAVTASLTVDYKKPIHPDATLILRAWPVKAEGRKIYMEGSIKMADPVSGEMVVAARATAVFVFGKSKRSVD